MIAFVEWEWPTFDGKSVTAEGVLVGFSESQTLVPGVQDRQRLPMGICMRAEDSHFYEVPLHSIVWKRWP